MNDNDPPRASRDVKPGERWAFLEHRTLAQVMADEAAALRARFPGFTQEQIDRGLTVAAILPFNPSAWTPAQAGE